MIFFGIAIRIKLSNYAIKTSYFTQTLTYCTPNLPLISRLRGSLGTSTQLSTLKVCQNFKKKMKEKTHVKDSTKKLPPEEGHKEKSAFFTLF